MQASAHAKTPDEFLDALQKIKDNTDAIRFIRTLLLAGQWAWDAYIGGSATRAGL